MTVEPLSHKGDVEHCARQLVPGGGKKKKKKIDILLDFSALNPSGIIGLCLIVTYFSCIWNDLYGICESDSKDDVRL